MMSRQLCCTILTSRSMGAEPDRPGLGCVGPPRLDRAAPGGFAGLARTREVPWPKETVFIRKKCRESDRAVIQHFQRLWPNLVCRPRDRVRARFALSLSSTGVSAAAAASEAAGVAGSSTGAGNAGATDGVAAGDFIAFLIG